jgi:hypothetical protein
MLTIQEASPLLGYSQNEKETEMKIFSLVLIVPVLLVACSIQANDQGQNLSDSTIVPSVTATTPTLAPIQKIGNSADEETEIRDLVENFGKKLQTVSLLSPDAAQEMEKQYSEFVVRTLLDAWTGDISKAPGRFVSSPWPDRIEITTLEKKGSDRYEISGFVVEVTSVEVVNGGAAAKIPVHIVVQKDQGHWMITEYAEER